MTANATHILRFTGFVIGAVLAVGLVLSGRMPESQAEAPARLSMASQPITEVGVSPAGLEFIDGGRLVPGGSPLRGSLTLQNFTGSPLRLRMRVSSRQRDLDRVVRLRVLTAGRQVFEGGLADLRAWSARTVRLLASERRRVQVRAWVPMSVKSGYEGRSVELQLEWKKARS
jgi:hypothetical protein